MRFCPYCRAEVNDFDSECEYCGAELPLDEEAALIIEKIENLLKNVNFVLNNQNEKASSIKACIDNIEVYKPILQPLSENKPIAKYISELNSLQKQLEMKLEPLEKKEKRTKKIRIIVSSILAELILFILLFLVYFFGKEATGNVILAILGFGGIIIGVGFSGEKFWMGFFSGLIGGIIMDYFVNWLFSTPMGQVILTIVWTSAIISFDIINLRKK